MGDEVPLGPGGLHPLDVLEQLPASMREAFDKQDLPALHQAVASMKPSEAKKWMKMCVDSGLWVPSNANEFEALQRDDDDDAAQEDEEETEEAGATESSS
jgi:cell division cycle protein 37